MTENLNRIITRVAAGETLTAEEKKTLCEEAPQEWENLTRRNQELAERLNTLENSTLPETEQLKRRFESEVAALKDQLAQSETDRSAAREELAALHYRRSTDRLAEACGFSDPDYFEFLCRQRHVDPDRETGCTDFINQLKEGCPRFFKLDLHAGPAEDSRLAAAAPARLTIEEMLTDAPSISE